MSFARRRHLASIVLLSGVLASCGSTQPSRFYMLSADDGAPGGAAGRQLSMTVGPITFPEYLDRSEMVIRRDGELELRAFERWGERLSSSFLAVLVENLAARTGSDQIYSFRWPGSVSPDYRLTGGVSHFEVDASSEAAVLSVQWRIADSEGTVVVPTRRSRFTAAAAIDDHGSGVAALSRTLAAFSDEIAAALAEL